MTNKMMRLKKKRIYGMDDIGEEMGWKIQKSALEQELITKS